MVLQKPHYHFTLQVCSSLRSCKCLLVTYCCILLTIQLRNEIFSNSWSLMYCKWPNVRKIFSLKLNNQKSTAVNFIFVAPGASSDRCYSFLVLYKKKCHHNIFLGLTWNSNSFLLFNKVKLLLHEKKQIENTRINQEKWRSFNVFSTYQAGHFNEAKKIGNELGNYISFAVHQ